jgi:thiol:disulfide interchange protein DsbA
MNCATIAAILDDHRAARLTPAERQAAHVHLAGCAACAATWSADEALRSETMGEPRAELLAELERRMAGAPAEPRAAVRRVGTALAAAAAVTAVVVAAARFYPTPPEAGGAPQSPAPVASLLAGRDYEIVSPAAVPARGATIPVIEFFMYQCFPCYAFEPDLVDWEARAKSYASLTRVPAIFNAEAELHARAFYTAAALGKLDALHAAFFEEIHARGNRLGSRAALAELFARFGVDAATFARAFDSSEVHEQVERAVALSRRYGIEATPSLVVAGRYSTHPGLAGPRLLDVVERLVAAAAEQAAEADEPVCVLNRGPLQDDCRSQIGRQERVRE